MERELQMLAQQSRASALPSTKSPNARSRLESPSHPSLSLPHVFFSSSRKKTRSVDVCGWILCHSASSCELRVPSFRRRKLDATTNRKQQREGSDRRRRRCGSYKQYGNKGSARRLWHNYGNSLIKTFGNFCWTLVLFSVYFLHE